MVILFNASFGAYQQSKGNHKMKYGILISDLSADEARTILNDLGGLAAPKGQVLPMGISHIADNEDEDGVAATGDVDSTGLIWDARIHAGSKTQNKDGTWKKRKGVQPLEVDQVEAELRARTPMPSTPVATAVAAPMVSAPAMPQPQAPVQQYAPDRPATPLPPVAAPVPAPQPPAAPVAPVAPTRDLNGLMARISTLFREQKIDPTYPQTIVDRINSGFGVAVTTLTDIAANPQMVDYAWQCLEVDGKAV